MGDQCGELETQRREEALLLGTGLWKWDVFPCERVSCHSDSSQSIIKHFLNKETQQACLLSAMPGHFHFSFLKATVLALSGNYTGGLG